MLFKTKEVKVDIMRYYIVKPKSAAVNADMIEGINHLDYDIYWEGKY